MSVWICRNDDRFFERNILETPSMWKKNILETPSVWKRAKGGNPGDREQTSQQTAWII